LVITNFDGELFLISSSLTGYWRTDDVTARGSRDYNPWMFEYS